MRINLFKCIEGIVTSKSQRETIESFVKKERDLYFFFDVVYNKNYEYEFDKSFNVESKYNKEDYCVLDWSDIKRKLYQRLILRKSDQASNFIFMLERFLKDFNQKDVDIILYGFKNRSLKGISSKIIYEMYPEFNKNLSVNEIDKELENLDIIEDVIEDKPNKKSRKKKEVNNV